MSKFETRVHFNGNIMEVDNAKIRFKNFEGRGSKFNHEGDRNFVWIIEDQELADMVAAEGYSVRQKETLDGDQYWQLKVAVKFNQFGPDIWIENHRGQRVKMEPETVKELDDIYFGRFDMDIRPYDWEVQGDKGRSAYLKSCLVVPMRSGSRFEPEDVPVVEE